MSINIWQILAVSSLCFLIFLAYIPSLIGIYYIVKNKMWLAIIPGVFVLGFPIIGNLIGIVAAVEGDDMKQNYEEEPLWLRCLFFIPINILLISTLMLVI